MHPEALDQLLGEHSQKLCALFKARVSPPFRFLNKEERKREKEMYLWIKNITHSFIQHPAPQSKK